MVILALETSTPIGSLAIAEVDRDQFQILATETWDKKSTHSDVATLALQNALATSAKELSQITHMVVDVGPGSFTGLRVGINLVKSLAYSLSKPVLSVTSLELLAFQNLKDGESALIAIRAIQNFYYFAVMNRLNGIITTTLPPQSGSLEVIQNHSQNLTKVLIEGTSHTPPFTPLAKELAHMAARGGSHYTFQPWRMLKPLYVRGSEAEEKLKKAFK